MRTAAVMSTATAIRSRSTQDGNSSTLTPVCTSAFSLTYVG
jgi:hypothetical protein